MYIGEVSRRTGATPKAIRLYEKLGLIPIPERIGRYRSFIEKDVAQIQIIKQAQRYGFKLAELKQLLDEETSCDDFPWEKAILSVEKKIQSITGEIRQLEARKGELVKFTEKLVEKRCG